MARHPCQNTQAARDRENQSHQRIRREKRDKLDSLKLLRGCVDCGYNVRPEPLEFDHLPQYEKSFTIGAAVSAGTPWQAILEEIEKCEVVCSNCHRIRSVDRLRGVI